MIYQLIDAVTARRTNDDGSSFCFPFVEGNTDYAVYKEWLSSGNTPVPAQEAPWREDVWTEFRDRRDKYLSRLADIAGRYYRKGDTLVPPAADAIAQGLLDMPARPELAVFTSRPELERAIVVAANNLLRAQLQDVLTSPTIKAALDKVFKA